MTLNQLVANYISLLYRLTGRVLLIKKFEFIGIIALTVVNTVSFMLAAFLPLKVLIMLGTDGVPRYLTFLVTQETKDQWLVGLALLAGGFYLIYSLTEFLISRRGKVVARSIALSAKKTELFENQQNFIADVFLKICQSWASYGMVIVGLAVGFWLEWRVFSIVVLACLLEYFAIAVVWNRYSDIHSLEKRAALSQRRSSIVNLCASLNFLVAFCVLFYLFLTNSINNFIIAIIVVLVVRQVMVRFRQAAMSAFFIKNNEEKILAVFYPHTTYVTKPSNVESNFLAMLNRRNRDVFFNDCSNALGVDLTGYDWSFTDTASKGIAVFLAKENDEQRSDTQLILKVFAGNQRAAFQNDLFAHKELSASVPYMATPLASAEQGGYCLTLFRCDAFSKNDDVSNETVGKIKDWLYDYQPNSMVIDKLARSQSIISERLTHELIERLYIGKASDSDIEYLRARIEPLKAVIKRQPLRLVNPQINRTLAIRMTEVGVPIVFFWHQLQVKPQPCLYGLKEYENRQDSTKEGALMLCLEKLEADLLSYQFQAASDDLDDIVARLPALNLVLND